MSDARAEILAKIRAANATLGPVVTADVEWDSIPRDYLRESTPTHANLLTLFEHRLVDYDATVFHTTKEGLSIALAAVLSEVPVRRVGIAVGMDRKHLPPGFDFVTDANLEILQVDQLDAVLSTCTVAIAETGTLVLQANSAQGRRMLTLVPDTHICIVNASQVVATVPEAFVRLAPTASLPTTFVSGPSATADIEMTRVKGVHGPRFLHVVLVHDDNESSLDESKIK